MSNNIEGKVVVIVGTGCKSFDHPFFPSIWPRKGHYFKITLIEIRVLSEKFINAFILIKK
jgi:hypothetical protein